VIHFSQPWVLLLLFPLLGLLIRSWRAVGGMAKSRKLLALVLRGLVVTSLVLALAGPELKRPNAGLCTIFLLDRSESVSDFDQRIQLQKVNEALQSLAPGDQASIIVFGKEAAMEVAPGALRSLDRVLSVIDPSGSDLASAVRLALASFPPGKAKRIVLLSDGNETQGDVAEAALMAATDGVEINTLPFIESKSRSEVLVSGIDLPSDQRIGQPFDIRIQVDATQAATGEITLDRNGMPLRKMRVSLTPGRNTLVMSDKLSEPGFFRYRASIKTEQDADIRNNVGMGFVAVRGRPRILVLQQDIKQIAFVKALRAQEIVVDLGGPGSVPVKPEDFQVYDAVILNDINAASMLPAQMQLLASSVRNSGIGFAMIGGENSFLPGGYYGTPLADILAVDLNIRQRKTFPSATILIVADMSGSMGMIEDGQPKVRLAAKAAEQTITMLSPLDRAGVAVSTDAIEFVAPIQLLTNKQRVISQVRKLAVGGGGIYIMPSLVFAEKELAKETTKVRHLILLADGADCDSLEGARAQVARMRLQKITTTCVSIGDGQFVPDLKQLAAIGGGRFYLAKKASQLPAIFTQDAAIMSRSAIEEGVFLPKLIVGDEAIKGIDSTPPLFGYCLSDFKPLSRVGMKTHKDDPLLATIQAGLGTSLAVTSDAQPRWAQRWVSWEGYGRFWAQSVRSISRKTSANRYVTQTSSEGGKGFVEITGADAAGNPVNIAPTAARVSFPDGNSKELQLTQTGPGKFTAAFEADLLGSYIVTVVEGTGAEAKVSSSGLSFAYPPEYRTSKPNSNLLQELVKSTNGKSLRSPSEAFRPVANPGSTIQPVWAWFLMFAIFALPLDIAVRRIALPLKEIFLKALVALRGRKVETPVASNIDRLQGAKARAAKRSESVTITPGEEAKKPEPPQSNPQAPPTGRSASDSLLAAKRNRSKNDRE